ncbi:MAG: CinA family nicotinamide mononucleotide deamidase-related protein [Planctomycetales bacterium]|nr:CinA family nicotinamide mononucleotide deamidase-related protein [Planctomycetales bacterium]
MHAEIIAIGTELTTGAKLDTNSQWLSQELASIGVPVRYHSTVADDLGANVDVFRIAAARADIVLITGGLGPTLDDLTREALAAVVERKLVLHEPSLEIIRGMFQRRGRVMPERNVAQAMFPEGSEVIANPRGTAPGIWLDVARAGQPTCHIAAMPGVPSEMKGMYIDEVRPRLIALGAGGTVIRQARVNCFGLGESAAEEMLGDVTARNRDPEVGITVHEATITLRIVAEAATADECDAKIADTKRLIRERMGEYVYGEEDEELEAVVARMLVERGLTLATSEGATGGLIASRLTTVVDSEQCFAGGEVLAAGRMDWGRESQRCSPLTPDPSPPPGARGDSVRQARSCRERIPATFCLAVTNVVAVSSSALPEPIRVAFVGLVGDDVELVQEVNLTGDPAIQRSRLAKAGLDLVRRHLLRPASR